MKHWFVLLRNRRSFFRFGYPSNIGGNRKFDENPQPKIAQVSFKIWFCGRMIKWLKSRKKTFVSLLKTFFNEKGLVRQHLDSYNEFIATFTRGCWRSWRNPDRSSESPTKLSSTDMGNWPSIAHNRTVCHWGWRYKAWNLPHGSPIA